MISNPNLKLATNFWKQVKFFALVDQNRAKKISWTQTSFNEFSVTY